MIQSKTPLVSVIIVAYNSENELSGCLNSIRDNDVSCEVFVVDNDSTDQTQGILKEFSQRWPIIKPIINTQNKGLAYAINQPLPMCKGKYILVLNPDTVLKRDTLILMSSYLDQHEDIGVIGPKCLYENGLPHTSSHRNWTIVQAILWRTLPYGIIRFAYDRFAQYKERDVFFVSGACLLIRRELFVRIGGYDESYFLTVEDAADLCKRVRETGQRVHYYPEVEIVHLCARSGSQVKFLTLYHSYHGALHFFKKHKGAAQAFILYLVLMANAVLKLLIMLLLSPLFPKRFEGNPKRYLQLIRTISREQFFVR